jgi:hypothetical protein
LSSDEAATSEGESPTDPNASGDEEVISAEEAREAEGITKMDQRSYWEPCGTKENQLKKLVDQGYLQSSEIRPFYSYFGQLYPTVDTNVLVAFVAHVHCGFGVHPSKFLERVCDWYNIETVHLKPNAITALSTFAILCEAFLGIEPNLNIWRYFYKPCYYTNAVCIFSISYTLRDADKYIPTAFRDSWKTWKNKWFGLTLSKPSCIKKKHLMPFVPDGRKEVPELTEGEKRVVEEIQRLRDAGLRASHVIETFIRRRLLPLQAREPLSYAYLGPNDPNRLTADGK